MDLGAGLMIGRVRDAWRERRTAGREVYGKRRRQYESVVTILYASCHGLVSISLRDDSDCT